MAKRATNKRRVNTSKKIIELKPVTVAAPNGLSKYREEFAEQAHKLCQLGATDRDLAEFFEVNTTTIWSWQSQHPEFSKALKRSKEASDDRVERSLYARATGYTYDTEKLITNEDGTTTRIPTTLHVPPDVTACIFWLKNRRPTEWRDKTDHDHNHQHAIHLQGGNMSVEQAQALFRDARNMTPLELQRSIKVIDAKVEEK